MAREARVGRALDMVAQRRAARQRWQERQRVRRFPQCRKRHPAKAGPERRRRPAPCSPICNQTERRPEDP
jgi:hypothetical protein